MMRALKYLAIAAVFLIQPIVQSAPARAESMLIALQEITEFNTVNRYKHPEFERSADIFDRRVLDNTKRVVGEVQNVTLTGSGSVETIDVDFDRLRLRQTISLNFNDMNVQAVSNAFILGFDDDQIEELYPQLLANIATAAGDEGNYNSLKNLIDVSFIAEDGRPLGKVRDVLFRKEGDKAEAYYIAMSYRRSRGEMVTIPFTSARVTQRKGQQVVQVDNNYADALLEYTQ